MCKCTPEDTKCTPHPEQESILGQFLLSGLDLGFGGILRRSVRATTKKGRQLFWQKSAPPDKILATLMEMTNNMPMWNSLSSTLYDSGL